MSAMSKKPLYTGGRGLRMWGLIALAALLQACGGGGGSSSPQNVTPVALEETGQLVITLTDAPEDFVSYTIDVTSIRLEKANGTTVETLSLSTRVNFAELTEVTEFLTIATVPAGAYQSVSLDLDFSAAEILLQNDEGAAVAAEAIDEQGMPLGALTVRLHLTNTDTIRIAPGIPAAFSLDFDLDASNEIDLTVAPPTVTVMPFLLATAELERDRPHRLRGVLANVDEDAAKITLKVRPFRHRTGNFGEYSFYVDDATEFEIDGTGYVGKSGLTAMAALAENTPVIALGLVIDGRYLADQVLAGSSVPWTDLDVVRGVVAAREGDTLKVLGATIMYRDGRHDRRSEFKVLLGEATRVTALGLDNGDLNKDSVSVGQRIVAFGELLDDASLDATQSHVRMRVSHLSGKVLQEFPLVTDLYRFNGRRLAVYNFSGTGISEENDADSHHYEIDTATLPLATVEAGDLVRVRGHVNTFGAAPADFNALTVIDVQTDMRGAVFLAVWPEATAQPLLAIEPARIDLDLSEARSLLELDGVPMDIVNRLEAIALLAPDTGTGAYAVRVRGAGEIHLYRQFSDLVDEIMQQLDSGNLLKRVAANGRYTIGVAELTTGRASFDFVEPGS